MKITNIKQQVRRADRYSLYIDESYAFSLSESELLRLGLRIGQQLDQAELTNLKHQAVEDKAYDQALGLIARRPRSQWEMDQYLRRKDYDSDLRQKIIQRLGQRGYLDDLEFARRWVASRRLLKNTSRRRLLAELRQKRVSDEAAEMALSEDQTDERAVLKDLAIRKRQQTKFRSDPQKLKQYLARQGFSYQDIKDVLAELDQA